MTEEQWKDVTGFGGRYQVSNMGKVRGLTQYSLKSLSGNGDVLCLIDVANTVSVKNNSTGYLQARLCVLWVPENKRKKFFYIHRLVAEMFLSNPNDLEEVNHKDFDRSNNCVENLEWMTRQQNMLHAWKHRRI